MFTLDNTEGFTREEIQVLNEALKRFMAYQKTINNEDIDNYEQNEKYYSDRLTNAWNADIAQLANEDQWQAVDALVKAIRL